MLLKKKNIHFVGIGGIGMSGIAHVLLTKGYKISGSDVESSPITRKLEALGARICEGHSAANLPKDAQVLVYSSSIAKDNPELKEARRRAIKIAHRAEILGELFNKKKGIAVTGTHGKTTTTSLVSVMLKNLGLDPTAIIGGEVAALGGNASVGRSEFLVAEADESDSSFLRFKPYYAIITNIEMEHLDHYKDLPAIKAAYRAFANNLKTGGAVFYNHEDPNSRDVLKGFMGTVRSFGFSVDSDIYPKKIEMKEFNTSFDCIYKGKRLGRIELKIPGRHNILNALAAVLAALEMGFQFKDIALAIKNFDGAKRRFQLRSDPAGIMLIDDYAHHPTEIKAVIDACKNWKGRRIIAVFQPHRYTRTKHLADSFAGCFRGADKVILTDIYAASEKPIRGVSSRNIYDKMKKKGFRDVEIVKKEAVTDHLMNIAGTGDMILILGAGDIKSVADQMEDRIRWRGIAKELKSFIKGSVRASERFAAHTSFRIGGPASVWVEPKGIADLRNVLAFAKKRKIATFVIGNGSNLLVNDSGFNGIVIRLESSYFRRISIKGGVIKVGAGFALAKLIRIACEKGLGGMESLVGIPGTVGGAVYMNAGGYTNPIYRNIGDLVKSVKVMDHDGNVKNLRKGRIEFGYRRSNLGPYIILEAHFSLTKSDRRELLSSLIKFLKIKKEKQVLEIPSAGCIFKNPEGFHFTCGQMIDMLGLKGKRIGGAEISAKHANFIVNRKGARCEDVLGMIDLIKNKVKESYDIDLELEVEIL